jgi:phosphohistidine phosphatase SixA
MLVSDTERTIESAAIIADALGIPPERIERTNGLDRVDERTVAIVRAKFDAADVLIVVGHQVTAEHLPAYLEVSTDLIAPHPVEKGGGVIMDWETKALEWF